MDWIKKNPIYVALIGVGVLVVAGLAFFFMSGSGGGQSPAATGATTAGTTAGATTAGATTAGATTAGATTAGTATTGGDSTAGTTGMAAAGGYPGGGGGAGNPMGAAPGGGATAASAGVGGPDEFTNKRRMALATRPNPMASEPYWRVAVRPPPPPPPAPVFTPPTPPVFGRGNLPLTGPGGPAGPPQLEIGPAQRMSGVLYSSDQVLAIVEQQGAERGQIVQPGDILNDGRVIAVSPTTVTIERNGRREEIPLTPGSLNNLPPAGSFRAGLGGANPGGAFGAGLPGGGGAFGAFPGAGYPGAGGRGGPPGGFQMGGPPSVPSM